MMLWKILYGVVWIWQFPQNIIGWFMALGKTRHVGPAGFKFVGVGKEGIGFCLGEYLFTGGGITRFIYGRGILSRKFGPLYLPLIPLPTLLLIMFGGESLVMNFPPTKWAMKYGRKNS